MCLCLFTCLGKMLSSLIRSHFMCAILHLSSTTIILTMLTKIWVAPAWSMEKGHRQSHHHQLLLHQANQQPMPQGLCSMRRHEIELKLPTDLLHTAGTRICFERCLILTRCYGDPDTSCYDRTHSGTHSLAGPRWPWNLEEGIRNATSDFLLFFVLYPQAWSNFRLV